MIKITVKHIDKTTRKIVGEIVREFDNDKDSIEFIKDVDFKKMDGLVKELEPNKTYKPSMILKHPKSSYGYNMYKKGESNFCQYNMGVITQPKDRYNVLAKSNNIETTVKIEHI